MKEATKITTPLNEEKVIQLKAGDFVNRVYLCCQRCCP